MECPMIASKSEVSMYPWKEPKERIPLAVRQIHSFLRASARLNEGLTKSFWIDFLSRLRLLCHMILMTGKGSAVSGARPFQCGGGRYALARSNSFPFQLAGGSMAAS